jgi:hypothetical protein
MLAAVLFALAAAPASAELSDDIDHFTMYGLHLGMTTQEAIKALTPLSHAPLVIRRGACPGEHPPAPKVGFPPGNCVYEIKVSITNDPLVIIEFAADSDNRANHILIRKEIPHNITYYYDPHRGWMRYVQNIVRVLGEPNCGKTPSPSTLPQGASWCSPNKTYLTLRIGSDHDEDSDGLELDIRLVDGWSAVHPPEHIYI